MKLKSGDIIKAYCKFEYSMESMHDELCPYFMEVNKCHFPKFICCLLNSFLLINRSTKLAPYSGRPRSAVTKSNINKNKSIIEKDTCFTVRQQAQITNYGLVTTESRVNIWYQ